MRRRGFVFGDIHFPFHHKQLLALALYLCIKRRPKYIVQVGDMFDYYSASKFSRSYNLFTPIEEVNLSRGYSERFWAILNKYCPDAEKFQLLGNHCVRPHRRIMEKAPEFEHFLVERINELYTFPGVKTIYDSREEFQIDDIWYQHGHRMQLGAHATFNLQNTVVGHTHRGGTVYLPIDGHLNRQIFEANAGYLGDPLSPGLSYTAQKRATRWTHGVLYIEPLAPVFVPLWPALIESLVDDKVLFEELLFD
jgi:hypothetical protein